MTQFCSVTHDAHAEYNIDHVLINVKVAQIHYSAFNEALPLKLNWCKHAPEMRFILLLASLY